MGPLLRHVLAYIEEHHPAHAARLATWVPEMDEEYFAAADDFFERYRVFAEAAGGSLDRGLDGYLRLCASMLEERLAFLRSGRYASTSFAEVERTIYLNPGVFEAHMHGLVFAQFLWREQYARYEFFRSRLGGMLQGKRSYLEIGGGHGLYLLEAARQCDAGTSLRLIDISPSSMDLARGTTAGFPVEFEVRNALTLDDTQRFDFITMGEVLEHVEDPLSLLVLLRRLLSDGGAAFVSAPTNSPTIDHIHLFEHSDQIREMLAEAGLEIIEECTRYSEPVDEERAKRLKVAQMFAAFVQRRD